MHVTFSNVDMGEIRGTIMYVNVNVNKSFYSELTILRTKYRRRLEINTQAEIIYTIFPSLIQILC